jgi:hypothetical protein
LLISFRFWRQKFWDKATPNHVDLAGPVLASASRLNYGPKKGVSAKDAAGPGVILSGKNFYDLLDTKT